MTNNQFLNEAMTEIQKIQKESANDLSRDNKKKRSSKKRGFSFAISSESTTNPSREEPVFKKPRIEAISSSLSSLLTAPSSMSSLKDQNQSNLTNSLLELVENKQAASKSNTVPKNVKHLSNEDPISDFHLMLENKNEDLVIPAIQQMEQRITSEIEKEMIILDGKKNLFLECLRVLRKSSIEQKESFRFNRFFENLKKHSISCSQKLLQNSQNQQVSLNLNEKTKMKFEISNWETIKLLSEEGEMLGLITSEEDDEIEELSKEFSLKFFNLEESPQENQNQNQELIEEDNDEEFKILKQEETSSSSSSSQKQKIDANFVEKKQNDERIVVNDEEEEDDPHADLE